MSKSILEVDSLQMSFADKLVLNDVYLKCETGEIIGLLGRNGTGKSTLLKIIFGIIQPQYKFVRINGEKKDKTESLLKEISYLSQDNFIPQYLTVAKAISLSIDKHSRDSFLNDAMIDSIKDRKIHQLSGGELRYLEINLILSNSAKFALLDEPYNGLSPIMIEKVNSVIKEKSKSKGIIITDHNYENVIEMSTKLLLLVDGKTQPITDKSELISRGYLHD